MNHYKEVIIRLATELDYDGYYHIKCDSQNIVWGGFDKAPEYSKFREVFLNRLNSPNRREYVCEVDYSIVGYLAAIEEDDVVEISYGVLAEASGKGVATALIKNVSSEYPNKDVIAWVSENNKGSERCLIKNGFVKQNKFETRYLSLTATDHKFYKWERKSAF